MFIFPIKKSLPTIVQVSAFVEDGFCITLSNNHSIWLELADRVHEPRFAKLIERGIFHHPKTDGKCMYWQDGPSLSLTDILKVVMLNNQGSTRTGSLR